MYRLNLLSAACILLLFALSCSSSSISPTGIEIDNPLDPVLTSNSAAQSSQADAHLWGIWDIFIDTEKETIEAVPLRGAAFALNAVIFVDGPPSNLLLSLVNVDHQSGYVDIEVEVGLQHPFPGLSKCTGFDVMGVFMGAGTDAYLGPDGFPIAGDSDQQMSNPDGYTRWFNAPEFTNAGGSNAMLGYVPGAKGSPGYTPTAELNPYNYYADGLGTYDDAYDYLVANPTGRGSFTPGSTNYRFYDIRFPDTTGIKFQYAVVAHWKGTGLPDPTIEDFPPEANADEAPVIDVVDSTNAYYEDGVFGGNVRMDISVLDWSADCSGVLEYEINCYSDAWTGPFAVNMTPTVSGDNYCTFYAVKEVDVLTSSDPLPVWIEVVYPGLDYTNNLGVINDADGDLAAYFKTEVAIVPQTPPWIEVLTPNGGETLPVGTQQEITWDSKYVYGTVSIEYSKDNFLTPLYVASNEDNDGSYMWTIPNDPSTTVKVRVRATNPSYLNDTSDGDFTIGGSGWARAWGTAENDEAYAVGVDYPGNIYVAGYNGASGIDWAYLRKYDTTGTMLYETLWGGGIVDVRAYGIVVDAWGNNYVTGSFMGTVDFDPGTGTDIHTSNGDFDVFLISFDSDGVYQWVRTWGGAGEDQGVAIAMDGWGGLDITGSFRGTADFDPGTGTDNHSSNGETDVFLCQIDTDANFYWAVTWGGSDADFGKDVAVEGPTNVYVTGDFIGTVDFDPGAGTDNHTSNGVNDIFLSRFNSSGLLQWAHTWGGSGQDFGWGVSTGNAGSVYATGEFWATVDFDPGTGTENHTSVGWGDVFLSNFDSSGNLQWVRTWGGILGDSGMAVTADDAGLVFVTGNFHGTVDFDPGGGTDSFTSAGGSDIFVSKLDSTGAYHWVRPNGSTADAAESGYDVMVDDPGNILVCGTFWGTAQFAPLWPPCNESSVEYDSNGNFDAFVIKYLPDGCW